MRRKSLSWLPALLIMLVIFSFSSKPADVSGENSLNIANYVMTIYEKITDTQVEEEYRTERLLNLDHYIRKSSHFIEYAILAAAYGLPLWISGIRGRKLWLWSVLLAAAYALSDEFHQRFIPGRSGELKDVLLDSFGAAFGATIFIAVTIALKHRNKNSQARELSE